MNTFLFIGKSHFPNDPRLYHRIILELLAKEGQVTWVDLCNTGIKPDGITVLDAKNTLQGLRAVKHQGSDYVQISDPREWIFGLFTVLFTSSKLIYDSHEDYFGQHTIKWEESRNPIFLVSRYVLWVLNLFCAFISEITFTTDHFGSRHLKHIQPNTHCLPNFVREPNKLRNKESFEHTKLTALRFLYVGSYNSSRGLIEFISHLKTFNSDHNTNHTLHIYGFKDKFPIIIRNSPICVFNSYTPIEELYRKMITYDIGICTLLDRIKYHRNIPIKILEYMALGIPCLCSDFGYMKTYAVDHGAGIGISPTSYSDFEQAVLQIQDVTILESLSQNGVTFSQNHTFGNIFNRIYAPLMTSKA